MITASAAGTVRPARPRCFNGHTDWVTKIRFTADKEKTGERIFLIIRPGYGVTLTETTAGAGRTYG
jgi:hypothetical protein